MNEYDWYGEFTLQKELAENDPIQRRLMEAAEEIVNQLKQFKITRCVHLVGTRGT